MSRLKLRSEVKTSTAAPRITPVMEGKVFNSISKDSDVDSKYQTYSQTGSKEDMAQLVKALKPDIQKSMRRHLGSTNDPIAYSYAKSLVVKALPRYNPQQSSLSTFVDRQTQPIIRWQSRRNRVAHAPDLKVLEDQKLRTSVVELEAELGRSPSDQQIADYTGYSLKKVRNIQNRSVNMQPTSTLLPASDDAQINVGDLAVINDAASSKAWADYVYYDLDPIDQAIFDHSTGLKGGKILSNKDLAEKLKLTPGAISQRKAKIQAMLDKETLISPFN